MAVQHVLDLGGIYVVAAAEMSSLIRPMMNRNPSLSK
jgi:hypothetical protein